MRMASATSGVKAVATIVFGPPVEEKVAGRISLIFAATSRLPVRYKGLSGNAVISRRWPSTSQDRYVTRPGSRPFFASSPCSRRNHRYMCCVVLLLDSTTTGMPHSRFRRVFRHRSRKLVKLLTAPTRATSRRMVMTPMASSASKSSTMRCSTGFASIDSSISVTPSCLKKSRAWFPISAPACVESITASISLMGPRRSLAGGR
mmetsp:Transcript_64165/g.88148  ORF Transcript_64165/g.88148 Transcript_64165/m.88148 type:complete len:204 (+) Transcript_64165:1111-1722(+)